MNFFCRFDSILTERVKNILSEISFDAKIFRLSKIRDILVTTTGNFSPIGWTNSQSSSICKRFQGIFFWILIKSEIQICHDELNSLCRKLYWHWSYQTSPATTLSPIELYRSECKLNWCYRARNYSIRWLRDYQSFRCFQIACISYGGSEGAPASSAWVRHQRHNQGEWCMRPLSSTKFH